MTGFSQILSLFWRGFSKLGFLTLFLGLFWRGFSKLGLVLVGFSHILVVLERIFSTWVFDAVGFVWPSLIILGASSLLGVTYNLVRAPRYLKKRVGTVTVEHLLQPFHSNSWFIAPAHVV